MKHTLWITAICLVLASCDSIDQPAVSEENVDYANQSYATDDYATEADQSASLAKNVVCPCWSDMADFDTRANGLGGSSSWSHYRNHGIVSAFVKNGINDVARTMKIRGTNFCKSGTTTPPTRISPPERKVCTNILVEWSEEHLDACTPNIVGGRDLC